MSIKHKFFFQVPVNNINCHEVYRKQTRNIIQYYSLLMRSAHVVKDLMNVYQPRMKSEIDIFSSYLITAGILSETY